jgi:hypothetical protein
MKKQTAVEWLWDKINKDYQENGRLRYAYISNVFIQAKQMEWELLEPKKQTAVEWLLNEFQEELKDYGGLDLEWLKRFEHAKEMEKQRKVAYKILTTLGHVDYSIETYGVDIAIMGYEAKLLNNKDSFWEECLAIAKFYKQFNNK